MCVITHYMQWLKVYPSVEKGWQKVQSTNALCITKVYKFIQHGICKYIKVKMQNKQITSFPVNHITKPHDSQHPVYYS